MIEKSKHYALAIACGAKRGPKDSDLTFSPASLRDFLKALDQPEQKPAAEVKLMMTGGNAGIATRIVEIDDPMRERLHPGQMLYTTPPHRKPLTDVEIWNTYKNLWMFHPAEEPRLAGDVLKFARAIEAKLREKNT